MFENMLVAHHSVVNSNESKLSCNDWVVSQVEIKGKLKDAIVVEFIIMI
jgi:hypothetical protein